MKKIIIVFAVFFSASLSAQITPEELLEDLVEVKDGRFTATHNYILKLEGQDRNFQIATYSEAPTSVISRDNFVSLSTMIFVKIMEGMAQGQEHDIQDLDEIIGNADIEINLYMAKQGMQFEMKANGEVYRETMTWDEM